MIERATMTMRYVPSGIPIPSDIEDYNLYLGTIDNQLPMLDYDGDNGLFQFEGDGLKQPYETRMDFIAFNIVSALPVDEWSALNWLYQDLRMFEIFEGSEGALWSLWLRFGESTINLKLTFELDDDDCCLYDFEVAE